MMLTLAAMPIREGFVRVFDYMTPRNVQLIRAMYPNVGHEKKKNVHI